MNKETAKKQRLGIMGGTFDPVHYGHLVAAEGARHSFSLEKVIFVPAGKPPHKHGHAASAPRIRYKMTCLAIASNPFFSSSTIEVERPGPSYTIDTVRTMMRLYPAKSIYFITGTDAIAEIFSWKDAGSLLSMCNFVAAARPGYCFKALNKKLGSLPNSLKQNISFMEVPALDISSTDIRQRVREGKPIKYLLPESVEDYILKNNLYRS